MKAQPTPVTNPAAEQEKKEPAKGGDDLRNPHHIPGYGGNTGGVYGNDKDEAEIVADPEGARKHGETPAA